MSLSWELSLVLGRKHKNNWKALSWSYRALQLLGARALNHTTAHISAQERKKAIETQYLKAVSDLSPLSTAYRTLENRPCLSLDNKTGSAVQELALRKFIIHPHATFLRTKNCWPKLFILNICKAKYCPSSIPRCVTFCAF